MTFPTPQSLWITQLLCVINQLTTTCVVIPNDYSLTTYFSIITISIALTIITLAIFHASSLPLEIITFHSPETPNLIIHQSRFPRKLPCYILVISMYFYTKHCLCSYAPIIRFYSSNLLLTLTPSL